MQDGITTQKTTLGLPRGVGERGENELPQQEQGRRMRRRGHVHREKENRYAEGEYVWMHKNFC